MVSDVSLTFYTKHIIYSFGIDGDHTALDAPIKNAPHMRGMI